MLRVAWAAPNTALGLLPGLLSLCTGGRARVHAGAIEIAGGLPAWLLGRAGFAAITFGHVIIGSDARTLLRLAVHERVHVRQYEAWGPLFLPAYLLASSWELLRGRRAYHDNFFERQAFAADAVQVQAEAQRAPRV